VTVDRRLPFSSILMPNREGTGRPYVLLPSRHRSAWLLPTGSTIGQTGLRSFGHTGVKGFLARALVAANLLRGERFWLGVAPLERVLGAALGTADVRLAFCIGTSGAYRKLTAQVMTHRDEVLAYAKLATTAWARGALRREHETLLRLAEVDGLHGMVPDVLGSFPWRDAQVLLVTAGSGQIRSGRLTEQHAAFLRRLHNAFAHEERFDASVMWTRMVGTVNRLAPRMSSEWTVRWHKALARLKAGLGPVALPLSLAHRDFAPWNIRLGPRGLFVFDWETAADGMTPLYDIFHFQAVQAARAGRPFHPLRDTHQDIIAPPGCTWKASLAYLYLAYLLDMSLLYAEARLLAPQSAHGQESHWLGRHLDTWREGRRAVA
jgi:hypothetical protein